MKKNTYAPAPSRKNSNKSLQSKCIYKNLTILLTHLVNYVPRISDNLFIQLQILINTNGSLQSRIEAWYIISSCYKISYRVPAAKFFFYIVCSIMCMCFSFYYAFQILYLCGKGSKRKKEKFRNREDMVCVQCLKWIWRTMLNHSYTRKFLPT